MSTSDLQSVPKVMFRPVTEDLPNKDTEQNVRSSRSVGTLLHKIIPEVTLLPSTHMCIMCL